MDMHNTSFNCHFIIILTLTDFHNKDKNSFSQYKLNYRYKNYKYCM